MCLLICKGPLLNMNQLLEDNSPWVFPISAVLWPEALTVFFQNYLLKDNHLANSLGRYRVSSGVQDSGQGWAGLLAVPQKSDFFKSFVPELHLNTPSFSAMRWTHCTGLSTWAIPHHEWAWCKKIRTWSSCFCGAMSNNILCLWPRCLVPSVSIHETLTATY